MSLLLSTKVFLPHWAWKDRTTKIPGRPLEDIQPITIYQHSVPTWSKGKKKCYKDSFPFGVFVCMHIRVCTGVCTHTWKSSSGVCAEGNDHLCFGDRVPHRPRESPDKFSWPNKEPLESVHLHFPCVRASSSGPPYLSLYKCVSWDQTQVFHGKHFTDGAIFPTWETLKILTTVGINTFPLGLLQN